MADKSDHEQLHQMAAHRGLKLVRSRRRKEGTGDFGKYGLIDSIGKPIMGIEGDTLTADAGEIERFLRGDPVRIWKQSANEQPGKSGRSGTAIVRDDVYVRQSRRPKTSAKTDNESRASSPAMRESVATNGRKIAAHAEASKDVVRSKVKEPPSVELIVRPARPTDAAALASILNHLSGITISETEVSQNLAAVRRLTGGVFVALIGDVVGCCGWTVMPTLHRGLVGRVTTLIVDKNHRYEGIATRLLGIVENELATRGCALVEVMSDIDINNAHNFFRTLTFKQTSYRFTRQINPSS